MDFMIDLLKNSNISPYPKRKKINPNISKRDQRVLKKSINWLRIKRSKIDQKRRSLFIGNQRRVFLKKGGRVKLENQNIIKKVLAT